MSLRMTRAIEPEDIRKSLERSKSTARSGATRCRVDDSLPLEITVAVLGSSKVGKSALVSQYLWEGFVVDYKPTVEEFNWVEYDAGNGRQIMLQVIDSSGSHDFLAMQQLYIRTADAFVVVFAVDNPESFEEAKTIIDEILEVRHRKAPVVLIANKRDLYSDIQDWPVKDSYHYAYSRMIPIIEVTAKEQTEVADAFSCVMERLRDAHQVNNMGGLRKRRQSMPNGRAYSGIDVTDLERLKKKHKSSCVIS